MSGRGSEADEAQSPGRIDVRPPLLIRIVAFPLAATLFGMGFLGLQYTISERQLPGLVVVFIFLAVGFIQWRIATARLTLDGAEVVARNIFDTRRVHLRDIERFDVGVNRWGIELWLRHSYRKITVNAIQKSDWVLRPFERTKADALVERLNTLVLAARE
jgi:hypothetical protein